jgi:aryl-alcohol dehydrogenase-like predicted oxidoreductase
MIYQHLGNSGLIVSRLSLGTMTFGQGPMFGQVVNTIGVPEASHMVDMALDYGINFIDTANGYTAGESEIILGKILKNKRKQVIIATKCGFRMGTAITDCGLSRHHMLQSVQDSLKRLNTDYIDVLYLHRPDLRTPVDEIAQAIDDIIRQGWVRYVGISNFPAWLAQKLLSYQEFKANNRIIVAQMYYSLVGRDIENDFMPFAQDNRLGLTVWSPLASGFLTGRYNAQNPHPKDGRRSKSEFPPVNYEHGYRIIAVLQDIAHIHQTSVAQVALAWILAKKIVTSVVIGANKIEQLVDNMASSDLQLTDAEINKLDNISKTPETYPSWFLNMTSDPIVAKGLKP